MRLAILLEEEEEEGEEDVEEGEGGVKENERGKGM